MTVNVNTTQLKNWTIFVLGLAAAAYAAYASSAHTANGNWSAIVAAVLLGVERYVSDPSTGNTPLVSSTMSNPPA